MSIRPTIPCEICGDQTPMLGTKRCDRCWDLESRIKLNPELTAKIIAGLPAYASVEPLSPTEKGGSFAIALHSDGSSTDMNETYCGECGSNNIIEPGDAPVERSLQEAYAAQRPDEELRAVATELLRLYDWRNEIGRVERDFNHDRKQVATWLNQYGREKKNAWLRLRGILARGDVPPPALLAIPAEWLEPGAVVPVNFETTSHLIRMVRELLKPEVTPKMARPEDWDRSPDNPANYPKEL